MREKHPHNFSARVTDLQLARLEAIEAIYGRGANPSAIASTLLRHAAEAGPANYHLFMQRVAALSGELKANSVKTPQPTSLSA